MLLFLEQLLTGLQLGLTLFLMASGLTLVFGIMNVINLSHGSLFMAGAYVAASVVAASGSFLLGLLAGVLAAGLLGLLIELLLIRRLYNRDHLDQVLATFAVILIANEAVRMIFGRQPLSLDPPAWLLGAVEIIPGVPYPVYRLAVICVGLLVMLGLWLLVMKTRLGMWIRAGASNREMIAVLGVDIDKLYSIVFAIGAALAGLAGIMAGPFLAIQSGMGEEILILAFVVVVIGGIGSIKGAAIGALLVGIGDTLGRVYLPTMLRLGLPASEADAIGASLAAMSIYLLMALVLAIRPTGLFGGSA
jgi:branched-chain amino acid transport system permease protein